MSEKKKVGFIGVGLMGHGMAKNIVEKGHDLKVLANRNRERIEDLLARGATEAADAAELARTCDIVILCVTGTPQVEDVVYRENGLLAGAHDGLIVADASTAIPDSTVKVAADLQAKGAGYVDIPLTRTPVEAEKGELGVMMGGDKDVIASIMPVLECFADTFIHAGDIGAGHKLKLINNYIAIGQGAVVAEAIATAAKAGVDLQALNDIVMIGGARSVMFERFMKMALNDDPSALQFTINNMRKDLTYYNGMTDSLGSSAIVSQSVRQSYNLAVNMGYGDQFGPYMIDVMKKAGGE